MSHAKFQREILRVAQDDTSGGRHYGQLLYYSFKISARRAKKQVRLRFSEGSPKFMLCEKIKFCKVISNFGFTLSCLTFLVGGRFNDLSGNNWMMRSEAIDEGYVPIDGRCGRFNAFLLALDCFLCSFGVLLPWLNICRFILYEIYRSSCVGFGWCGIRPCECQGGRRYGVCPVYP